MRACVCRERECACATKHADCLASGRPVKTQVATTLPIMFPATDADHAYRWQCSISGFMNGSAVEMLNAQTSATWRVVEERGFCSS